MHGVFASMIKAVDEKRRRSENGFLGRWKKQGKKRRQWRYNNEVFTFFLLNSVTKVKIMNK